MVFLLFQLGNRDAVIPTSADLQWVLLPREFGYAVGGEPLDFTLPRNKLDFTVDE